MQWNIIDLNKDLLTQIKHVPPVFQKSLTSIFIYIMKKGFNRKSTTNSEGAQETITPIASDGGIMLGIF